MFHQVATVYSINFKSLPPNLEYKLGLKIMCKFFFIARKLYDNFVCYLLFGLIRGALKWLYKLTSNNQIKAKVQGCTIQIIVVKNNSNLVSKFLNLNNWLKKLMNNISAHCV